MKKTLLLTFILALIATASHAYFGGSPFGQDEFGISKFAIGNFGEKQTSFVPGDEQVVFAGEDVVFAGETVLY